MMLFAISGILLNHRSTIADINISRRCLPSAYTFERWNNGLLRGTLATTAGDSTVQVWIYGTGGVIESNPDHSRFTLRNEGLPAGADHRQIRSMVQTPDSTLWAAGQFGLYRRTDGEWQASPLPLDDDERLSDMTLRGDTLVVLSRSRLYIATPPYRHFEPLQLRPTADDKGRVSLFRTLWLIHSGELFGTAGKLLMDAVAALFLLLCLTGFLFWGISAYLRRRRPRGKALHRAATLLKTSLKWHDRPGRRCFGLLLFVALTGWALRPPLLPLIAAVDVPPIPFTCLDTPNPWADKLRMIRHDNSRGEWLVSTSEGFYAFTSLDAVPTPVNDSPPVSVMGQNVFERTDDGQWLCGSFAGLYLWNRDTRSSTDYFTGQPAPTSAGSPFGAHAVAGYSRHFHGGDLTVEYYEGCERLPMPDLAADLPISLWNVALEIHTGRIYTFLGFGKFLYITFAGLVVVWILVSGYRLRRAAKTARPTAKSPEGRQHAEKKRIFDSQNKKSTES